MTSSTKLSVRSLSSLFNWHKPSRPMSPRSGFLEMEFGVATELTHFDDLCYTSLRDLLPTTRPGSPIKQIKREELEQVEDRPAIKNRLVEQAARAYLLPACTPRNSSDQLLARYFAKFTSNSGENNNNNNNVRASRSCVHGCAHGCLSCLPTLLWLDLARVVQSIFRLPHLLPQYTLQFRHHAPERRRASLLPALQPSSLL